MNENLHMVVNDVHQTQHQTDIMLRISTEKKRCKVLLTVEGRLAGQTVPTLEQFWRELRSERCCRNERAKQRSASLPHAFVVGKEK